MSDRPQVIKRMREHDAKCLPVITVALEKGMPLAGIAQYLESYNVPPPQGKYWHEKAVRRIIRRHHLRPDREPADPAAPDTVPQAPDREPADPAAPDTAPGIRGTVLAIWARLVRFFSAWPR